MHSCIQILKFWFHYQGKSLPVWPPLCLVTRGHKRVLSSCSEIVSNVSILFPPASLGYLPSSVVATFSEYSGSQANTRSISAGFIASLSGCLHPLRTPCHSSFCWPPISLRVHSDMLSSPEAMVPIQQVLI